MRKLTDFEQHVVDKQEINFAGIGPIRSFHFADKEQAVRYFDFADKNKDKYSDMVVLIKDFFKQDLEIGFWGTKENPAIRQYKFENGQQRTRYEKFKSSYIKEYDDMAKLTNDFFKVEKGEAPTNPKVKAQNPFDFLSRPENFNKINIDDRLKEQFKNVLKRMSAFFEKKGYSDARNYIALFQESILKEGSISVASKEHFKNAGVEYAAAYYQNGNIVVREDQIGNDRLESTLCHEFIHFIVHNKNKNKDYTGSFLDEGATECLTREIYPERALSSYNPQVDMIKFIQKLDNSDWNNYRFLKGSLPINITMYSDALTPAENFQKKYFAKRIDKTDSDYITFQRERIDEFLRHAMSSKNKPIEIDEYLRITTLLREAPARDDIFIEKTISEHNKKFINKHIHHTNERATRAALTKLEQLQTLASEKGKGHAVEIDGSRYFLDRDGKCDRHPPGYQIGRSGHADNHSTISFEKYLCGKKVNEVVVNLKTIDFDAIDNNRQAEIDNLKQELNPAKLSADERVYRQLEKDGEFTRKEAKVFEASFGDVPIHTKVSKDNSHELLFNDRTPLKTEKIFIDVGKPLYDETTATEYSVLTDMQLDRMVKAKFKEVFVDNLSETNIAYHIENFKQSPDYNDQGGDMLSKITLKRYAIDAAFEDNYATTPRANKARVRQYIINSNDKFYMTPKGVATGSNGSKLVRLKPTKLVVDTAKTLKDRVPE